MWETAWRELRVERGPVPSSTSCCMLVLPFALDNHESRGGQPARAADKAVVGESESKRSIGAHAYTHLARALRSRERRVWLRRRSATSREQGQDGERQRAGHQLIQYHIQS